MSLFAIADAHEKGYDENLYLDAATRTFVEETGGANIIFIPRDGEMVTPHSDSILPSVTRRSLLYVGEHYLGMKTAERPVRADEIGTFVECGLCGTAAVISPVGSIDDPGRGETYCFRAGSPDSRITALRETLLSIQHRKLPAPDGWITEIE